MAIHLRSAEELEKMHRAGLFVHEVLTALRDAVRPGITTMDLEKIAEEKIAGRPGKAAFKGYRGRAEGECGQPGSAHAGRMGGGNGGWQPLGALRAHRGGYRQRAVDSDAAERDDRAVVVRVTVAGF